MSDIVDAMADRMAYEAEHMGIQMPGRVARCLARAAIRACHDAGGLVLREVPECEEPVDTWQEGYNAGLRDVRASVVEVGE